jgi:acylphosphatase
MLEKTKTVHVKIFGVVQGVGFRDYIVSLALSLALAGWVRNLSDGSVEVLFNGSDDSINKAIGGFQKGPLNSRVDDVKTNVIDPLGDGGSFPSAEFNIISDFIVDDFVP